MNFMVLARHTLYNLNITSMVGDALVYLSSSTLNPQLSTPNTETSWSSLGSHRALPGSPERVRSRTTSSQTISAVHHNAAEITQLGIVVSLSSSLAAAPFSPARLHFPSPLLFASLLLLSVSSPRDTPKSADRNKGAHALNSSERNKTLEPLTNYFVASMDGEGTNPVTPPQESAGTGGSGELGEESEDEALISKAQRLISKISSAQANPNPKHLHALASILETEESRSVFIAFPFVFVLISIYSAIWA